MKSVLVFLSTFNGEKYLRPLLDSLISQEGIELNVFIRDDGSKDGTLDIITEYASNYSFIKSEFADNIGYAKSFWSLFGHANKFDYYAFCDQDDIWDNNKLYKAVELLESQPDENLPLLYTSDVIAVNNDKQVLNDRLFGFNGILNFYQSLQKSVLPGCTFVFNNNAFNVLSKYNGYMESHDWAVYCIVSAFGKVVFDGNSYIYYRIHQNNTIGKSNVMSGFLKKIFRFFKSSKRSRSRFAKDFYECYKNDLKEEYASAVKLLGYYRAEKKKLRLIKDKRFHGVIFKSLVLLGKV